MTPPRGRHRVGHTMALDLAPRRPACSGDVDRGNARIEEAHHQVVGDTPADLLDDHRCTEVAQSAAMRASSPLNAVLPDTWSASCRGFRCSTRASASQGAKQMTAFLGSDAEVELHRTEIGEQRHVGCERSDVECGENLWVVRADPAGTETPSRGREPVRHARVAR